MFWDLTCVRTSEGLQIESAKLLGKAPPEYQYPSIDELKGNLVVAIPTTPKVPKSKNPKSRQPKPTVIPSDARAITNKLELTIKINTFPDEIKVDRDGWKTFEVDCDGQLVSITVKPKVFNKLLYARINYPQWVAAISGTLGTPTANGFILEQPDIQVFERREQRIS